MAINYSVSYSFSPNTTISSANVNTNFADNSNTWNGLEALTKTFAKLKVDVDPSTALEVATKQYVDQYAVYRRPVLQYSSATVVNLETGINGTSGQALIQFPDGSKRTDSTASRINFDITRNVALSGTAQSGLYTALSEANNTWYALYAVKVTDSSTNFVVCGTTTLPIQANYATLNTNFGTNGWVYLGTIRNGDNSGTAGDILYFGQNGNLTTFINSATGNAGLSSPGVRVATTAGATTLTYAAALGTGAANLPNHCNVNNLYTCTAGSTASKFLIAKSDTGTHFGHVFMDAGSGSFYMRFTAYVSNAQNLVLSNDAAESTAYDIFLSGFYDTVLGVGSNPLL